MHIILGLLGTLVTVLYLLNRLADMGFIDAMRDKLAKPATIAGPWTKDA